MELGSITGSGDRDSLRGPAPADKLPEIAREKTSASNRMRYAANYFCT
jgi:hypothetical protein